MTMVVLTVLLWCTSPVTYTEFPEYGPNSKGLVLAEAKPLRAGIDINSRIQIAVDEDRLRNLVSYSDEEAATQTLHARIRHLEALLGSVSQSIISVNRTVESYQAMLRSGSRADYRALRAAQGEMARNLQPLFNGLKTIEQARLKQTRPELSATERDEQTNKNLEHFIVYDGPTAYPWDKIREFIQQEIDLTHAALQRISIDRDHASERFALEIRAYLVNEQGQAKPLNLPRYNAVPLGARSVVAPLQFHVPTEEQLLYQRYQEMAAKTEGVKDLGAVLRASLEVQLNLVRPALDELLEGLKALGGEAEIQFDTLKLWRDAEKRERWLRELEPKLRNAAPDDYETAVDAWQAVSKMVDPLLDAVEKVRRFQTLFENLKNQDAAGVTATLLQGASLLQELSGRNSAARALFQRETWHGYYEKVNTFVTAVNALSEPAQTLLIREEGPGKDLVDLLDALKKIKDEIVEIKPGLINLLRMNSDSQEMVRVVGELNVPEGSRPRVIGESDLNTAFDLKLAGPRAENDEVHVYYHFYRRVGEDSQPVPRFDWVDTFKVRRFGWRDRVVAGFAFSHRQGASETWEPSASMSWLLSRKNWPDSSLGSGLGAPREWLPLSGGGLTAINLDFDDEEDVEVGLAPSISLFNHRVIAGYGWNLQAQENKTFAFVTIRLFNVNGLINNATQNP